MPTPVLAETYAARPPPGPRSSPIPETVTEARAMIEKALREQGLSLHELGQRDSRKEYFEQATEIYSIYLKHFDDSPESYRLTFYLGEILFHRLGRHAEAGEVYMNAARKNPKGEFTKDALYNAIGAFERVREKEVVRCTAAPNAPCAETENDKKFSAAIELYASYYPNDPDLPEILFRQGKFYYERHIYDPAVRLFGQLLDRYPNSPYAGDAGELVLDSFNRAADYQNIELWARKLKTAPAFKSADSQKRLNGLILGAVFKIGEQLADPGTTRSRRRRLRARRAGVPVRSARAQGLLQRGTRALTRRSARQGRHHLQHPGGEVSGHRGRCARGLERRPDVRVDRAVPRCCALLRGLYASASPRGPRPADAGYNAVLLRLSAHDYKAAVADGKRFTERFPKDPAVDDVYFLIGRAHEGERAHGEAEGTYREYLRRTKNPDRRVEAHTRLGQVLMSAGNRKGADNAFSEAVSEGRKNRKQAQGRPLLRRASALSAGRRSPARVRRSEDRGRPQGPQRTPQVQGEAARQGRRHLLRGGGVRGGRVGHRRALQDRPELRAVCQGARGSSAARGAERRRAAGLPRRTRHVRGAHRGARTRGLRGRLQEGA